MGQGRPRCFAAWQPASRSAICRCSSEKQRYGARSTTAGSSSDLQTNRLADPAVVLVDEIDLHLHPIWQRRLIGFLSERFPNTQFIVTAHSPLIVQAASDPLERPGYYWLAYEWSNLYLACAVCNRRHKGNLFPLTDPAARARNHLASTSAEVPLLLDPGSAIDPESLIGFRAEIPYPVGGDARAIATIDALGLHREPLNERRRERIALLRRLVDILTIVAAKEAPEPAEIQLARDAEAELALAVCDDAEFAAMTRAFLNARV